MGPRPGARDATADALSRGVDPVTVAGVMTRGLDETIANVLGADLRGEPRPACARGCSSCCHQRVEVTAPEVFLIARTLEPAGDRDVMMARVAAAYRDDATRATPAARRCVFLDRDGACSIYAVRPLACRRAHSVDREICEAVFANPSLDALIPASPSLDWNASALVLGYLEGSAIGGRPPHQYELHAALSIALSDPTCEARWLSGEDALAAARTRSADDLFTVLGRAQIA
jgi:Fe-S-cluster containining protein